MNGVGSLRQVYLFSLGSIAEIMVIPKLDMVSATLHSVRYYT